MRFNASKLARRVERLADKIEDELDGVAYADTTTQQDGLLRAELYLRRAVELLDENHLLEPNTKGSA